MDRPLDIVVDQTFDKVNFAEVHRGVRDFEACRFVGSSFCDMDIMGCLFTDCVFENCNLSMLKLVDVALRGCSFEGCKMLGVDFSPCKQIGFDVRFKETKLDYSIFSTLKISKTSFVKCSLIQCDFTECDLSKSIFTECDLSLATFGWTNLEGADLSTARNYTISVKNNRVKKAKFSLPDVIGLLADFEIEIEQ